MKNPATVLRTMWDRLTEPARKLSPWAEPVNQSAQVTASTLQSYLRAAEAGDPRLLFGLYRDVIASSDHIQGEWGKRKMAMLAQPAAIQPWDPDRPDDAVAAAAIRAMIARCDNWTPALVQLLDATLWPVTVMEKVFEPIHEPVRVPDPTEAAEAEDGTDDATSAALTLPLRYRLAKLELVPYQRLCFRHAFQPAWQMALANASDQAAAQVAPLPVDNWEPDLHVYAVFPNGLVDYALINSQPMNPTRHVVHRGHLLLAQRDTLGGPLRALLGWWLLGMLRRDWFGLFMQRFGQPFVVGRTDVQDVNSVSFLKNALATAQRICGLVVDHETEIELKEVMTSGAADAYERFLGVCNRAMSKIITGLDPSQAAAGLNAGQSRSNENVREDVRMFDQLLLGDTLRKQVFEPFLRINGLTGAAPRIVWGGLSDADAKQFADLLVSLAQAGLEPADAALPTINERIGFEVQRKAAPASPPLLPPAGPMAPGDMDAPDDDEPPITPLRADPTLPKPAHPSDQVAARKAKVLAAAYRGSLAPVRQIVLASASPEECERQLRKFYADWSPDRVAAVTEEALQLCAAAGAADGRS